MNNNIAANILRVRENIANAALRSGRDPASVSLIAASKTQSAESCREAILGGVDGLGENRAQELTAKYAEGAYSGTELHFIGSLQRNKVNALVGKATLIQSVSSLSIAEAISKRAATLGIIQRVLLEVNVSGEASKSGADYYAARDISEEISTLKGLQLDGFMALASQNGNISQQFEKMCKICLDFSAKEGYNSRCIVLSMGMSGDYELAVECGATMVRVGSAIFGSRI
ncbi:MAG: YggS family pyridoxal phosphate-dependent enzyme [Oscillospiraceae bacterium]|jgi:pyridoxal phosphate enzyme (YggS family)|nr:YggS family pyridoxal phosphate-dependent enzyme [Oscillospiraceae bacterium]